MANTWNIASCLVCVIGIVLAAPATVKLREYQSDLIHQHFQSKKY
jgi:hypothetical protein